MNKNPAAHQITAEQLIRESSAQWKKKNGLTKGRRIVDRGGEGGKFSNAQTEKEIKK